MPRISDTLYFPVPFTPLANDFQFEDKGVRANGERTTPVSYEKPFYY